MIDMGRMEEDILLDLIAPVLGPAAGEAAACIEVPDGLYDEADGYVSAAELAFALSLILHHGLLRRVPTGAAYVADCRAAGRKVMLDHGALRTICLPDGATTGALPAGAAAFARIMQPLGYALADTYPLDRLRMTGYAWCHKDYPETIAQYFISELHVDRFDDAFQQAACRIFETTRDPLDARAAGLLDLLEREGRLSRDDAGNLLPSLTALFDRHHDIPSLADYEILKEQSSEAAWIATEGNAFNHGTDRVSDLDLIVQSQRDAGRAMKDKIEVSGSGRVRQTATRADWLEREFVGENGTVRLSVPGSFYEFISRDIDPETGTLALRFDSGTAQGIF